MTTATSLLAVDPSTAWQPTTWRGRAAYASTWDGWEAIVCPGEARLVELRDQRTGSQLLYTHPKPAEERARTQEIGGGHQLWVAPQSIWVWPPRPDWEFQAAAEVFIQDGALHLVHPHADSAYPAFTRTYAWSDGGLACGVQWRPAAALTHHTIGVMQVFQVLNPHEIDPLIPSPHTAAWPRGFGVRHPQHQPQIDPTVEFPDGLAGVVQSAAGWTVSDPPEYAKLFFPVQPITARTAAWTLTVEAPVDVGRIMGQPDLGLVTQVNRARGSTNTELEQLSAKLLPVAGQETVSSTVRLVPRRR